MRDYELVLVLRPGVSEIEKKKVLDEVLKVLGEAKTETKELGRRTLAYPIKKESEGLYILLNINYSNGTVAQDLERKLLMNDKILRHLLVRTKVEKKGEKSGRKKS